LWDGQRKIEEKVGVGWEVEQGEGAGARGQGLKKSIKNTVRKCFQAQHEKCGGGKGKEGARPGKESKSPPPPNRSQRNKNPNQGTGGEKRTRGPIKKKNKKKKEEHLVQKCSVNG